MLTLHQVRVGDWKLVKGTTYDGAWDSWYTTLYYYTTPAYTRYGPSGRGGRPYDIPGVRSSGVGRALATLGRTLPGDQAIR